jgi:hypothetical protein
MYKFFLKIRGIKLGHIFLFLFSFVTLSGCSVAFAAMGSSNFTITNDSINSGGNDASSSTNFSLQDTIGGEASAGESSSSNFRLSSGYSRVSVVSPSGGGTTGGGGGGGGGFLGFIGSFFGFGTGTPSTVGEIIEIKPKTSVTDTEPIITETEIKIKAKTKIKTKPTSTKKGTSTTTPSTPDTTKDSVPTPTGTGPTGDDFSKPGIEIAPIPFEKPVKKSFLKRLLDKVKLPTLKKLKPKIKPLHLQCGKFDGNKISCKYLPLSTEIIVPIYKTPFGLHVHGQSDIHFAEPKDSRLVPAIQFMLNLFNK